MVIHLNVYAIVEGDFVAVESTTYPEHTHGPIIEARRAALQARLNAESCPAHPERIAVIEPGPPRTLRLL